MPTDYQDNMNKTRYTHRDYESIRNDLINAIPSLTQEWTSREESDPGIVLIKLISMFGDTLSYNVDKIALELYLRTVTQRKNCAMILELLGYKMHWYRSAKLLANMRLDNYQAGDQITIWPVLPPGALGEREIRSPTTFSAGGITYTAVLPPAAEPNVIIVDSSKENTPVYLVEGRLRTTYFNANSLSNNRFYFNDNNVDEANMWLTFSNNHNCQLVDSLYTNPDDTIVSFEFNVDEYDRPYIELISYWRDILGSNALSGNQFTLQYIVSSGSQGDVSQDQLTDVIGAVRSGTASLVITHPSNNTYEVVTDGWTSPGYDPQTVDEAREDASNYIFTENTLVTAVDFERAVRRVLGVTASKLVDTEIANYEGLNIQELATRAYDDFTTQSSGTSTAFPPYMAIMYLIYQNFSITSNYYNSLLSTDPYYIRSYDQFNDGTPPSAELTALGAYPYRPNNSIVLEVTDEIQENKVINVEIDYGTTKVYPFKVAGTLYLVEPQSPEDTLSIINNIDSALTEFYYPSNHSYGIPPKFIDIVTTVQDSDTRIQYFDAYNNLVEYNPPCNGLNGFDTTSFAMYNGLSSNFNLAPRYLVYSLRNTSNNDITLENLSEVRGDTVTLPAKSIQSVSVDNIAELTALSEDIRSNTSIIYLR